MKKSELPEYMISLQIETLGEGDYIIDQAPNAGEKVEEGSKIRIVLGDK